MSSFGPLKPNMLHTFFECNPYVGVCFHIISTISYPMSGEITNPTVDG